MKNRKEINDRIIITDDDYFNDELIVIKVSKLFDVYVRTLKLLYLNYNPTIIGKGQSDICVVIQSIIIGTKILKHSFLT